MKKSVSFFMAVIMIFSTFANVSHIVSAASGTVMQHDFEDGENTLFALGSVCDAEGRGIGKSVSLVCKEAGRDSFNTSYFGALPLFNSVAGYKASELEGNNFFIETEFDILSKDVMKKFGSISIAFNSDRVVEQYKDTTGHLRINMANERINTYFRRNNAGGQEDVGEFKDNKWYRIKLITQVTGPSGQETKLQKALYINGTRVLSGVTYTSENTGKLPYYNAFQICCDGGIGSTILVDNVSIKKYNGAENATPENDRLISLIRKADRMVRDAEEGSAAAETLSAEADKAYQVYTSNASKEEVSAAANELSTAVEQAGLDDNDLDIYVKEEPFVPEPIEYIVNTDFENEDVKPFAGADKVFRDEDVPYIGKSLYLSEKTSSVNRISETFTPTYLLRNSNPATDAYTNEGAGCDSVTEFDLKLDGVVANKKNFQVKLHMDTSSDGTPIHRLNFDGSTGKMQISLPGGLTFEDITGENFLKDDTWYRIKIKLHATDTNGNPTNTLSIYVDGECIAEKKKVQSTTAGKTDKYNILTLSGLGSGTGAMIDNLKIYKVIAEKRNEPLDYGKPLSVLRKAKTLLNTVSVGNKPDDYDEQEITARENEYNLALENMESAQTQADVDKSAVETGRLLAAIKPNGYPVDVDEPVFSEESLVGKSSVNIQYNVFSNKYAEDNNTVIAFAMLYKKASGFDEGRIVKTLYSSDNIGKSSNKQLNINMDISQYTEEEKADMYIKTFVWNMNGQYPLTRPEITKYTADNTRPVCDSFDGTVSIKKSVVEGETQRRKITVFVNSKPNSDITLTVLKNGKEYSELETLNADNAPEIIEYAGQCRTDENGIAAFEFFPGDDDAEYKSRISGYEYGDFYDMSIYAIGLDKTEEIFKEMAAGNNIGELSNILEKYRNYLDIDENTYTEAVSKGISGGDILLNMDMKTYKRSDIDKFTSEVNSYMKSLSRIKSAANADVISDAIDNIKPFIERKTQYYAKTAEQKRKICAAVYKNHAGINGLSALISEINNGIKALPETSNRGNTSGGGSSGGGGGGYVATPAVKAEENSPIEEAKTDFTDLDNVKWAEEAISVLAARGIINGRENGRFYPEDKISREEFTKLIICAFNLEDENARSEFSDVDKNAWYYKYVASGEKNGIVNGTGDGLFGVGAPITREELAAMIYRCAVLKGIELSADAEYLPFDDDEAISEYAREAVESLAKNKVINGMGANMFMPAESCTRAQAAKMLYEVCRRMS